MKNTSTQRPPVLSDHSLTVHYANSTVVKHLCIKTTCLERPPFTGSLGDLHIQVPLYTNYYSVSLGGLYIQVPMYINYYNVSLGWSLYTGSPVHQLLQCVPWVAFIYWFHCIYTVCTHCCVVHCMHFDLPALMYIHTHLQPTYITFCVHMQCVNTLDQLYLAELFSSLLVKILGMFLHLKSLLLSLVGTLDSEYECIEIP